LVTEPQRRLRLNVVYLEVLKVRCPNWGLNLGKEMCDTIHLMNLFFKKIKQSFEFHLIFSIMRSGSSLCGHLLSEANIVKFAGETNTPLTSKRSLFRARKKILQFCNKPFRLIPVCDKTVNKIV